ncbi:MAG: DUF4126 domain-containing protein [Deltaproteobacteria bacterium]|jgi:hypothetical protein|nr:DUF4126 domain-containing protein [Deltaproteobacteria bacterium]
MDQLDVIIKTISLTMGVAWASGINLYAAILVLGILGSTGNITLPPDLVILTDPLILIAAGTMYTAEFFADKIPGVDNGWDTVHTFIRIPLGALLAAAAVGEVNPAVAVAAALLGGGLAASTHATKAGSRVLINTSPEPITNWFTSLGEDVAVIAGLWTAIHYPWLFVIFILIFILLLFWLLPKIWSGVKKIFSMLRGLFQPAQKLTKNNEQ